MNLASILLVMGGGAIGSLARYLMIQAVIRMHPGLFPLGTICVNILGSACIGVLMARFVQQDNEPLRLLLVTGLLGGFTTFSAFSWDTLCLLQRGHVLQAGLYAVGSVALSVIAAWGGFYMAGRGAAW